MMIDVTVNGSHKSIPDGMNVRELLDHLGIQSDRVAVELNRSIVRQPDWSATQVGAGAAVEIVHFVGGG